MPFFEKICSIDMAPQKIMEEKIKKKVLPSLTPFRSAGISTHAQANSAENATTNIRIW